MDQYKVTCRKCKGSNVLAIDDKSHQIFWKGCDRIISGRYRLDNQWGFQCICGSNSLLTKQENEYITDKVNPDPKEIADVVKNLIPDERKLFVMEKVRY